MYNVSRLTESLVTIESFTGKAFEQYSAAFNGCSFKYLVTFFDVTQPVSRIRNRYFIKMFPKFTTTQYRFANLITHNYGLLSTFALLAPKKYPITPLTALPNTKPIA